MRIVRAQQSVDLHAEIKRRFSEFNLSTKPSKGRVYPEDLKELVRQGIRQGMRQALVRELTGISKTAFISWSTPSVSPRKPRRLAVIDDRGHVPAPSLVLIRLPSGICVELPGLAAITAELLTTLCKVEVANVASR